MQNLNIKENVKEKLMAKTLIKNENPFKISFWFGDMNLRPTVPWWITFEMHWMYVCSFNQNYFSVWYIKVHQVLPLPPIYCLTHESYQTNIIQTKMELFKKTKIIDLIN